MSLKILIIEDELIIAEFLKTLIEKQGYKVVAIAIDYKEAKAAIEGFEPNLILLDINLNCNINGVEIAHIINTKYKIPFIFTSSYSDPSTLDRVIATNPLNYLVKPYKKEQLYTVLKLAEQKNPVIQKSNRNAIFIKDRNKYKKIEMKDILWIKADGNYLEVHAQNGIHLIRATLSNFTDKLNNNFIRTHKSYIVNVDYITKVEGNRIALNTEKIPVSRMYKELLFEKLNIKII